MTKEALNKGSIAPHILGKSARSNNDETKKRKDNLSKLIMLFRIPNLATVNYTRTRASIVSDVQFPMYSFLVQPNFLSWSQSKQMLRKTAQPLKFTRLYIQSYFRSKDLYGNIPTWLRPKSCWQSKPLETRRRKQIFTSIRRSSRTPFQSELSK